MGVGTHGTPISSTRRDSDVEDQERLVVEVRQEGGSFNRRRIRYRAFGEEESLWITPGLGTRRKSSKVTGKRYY